MSAYSFLKEAKLYLVIEDLKYEIEISSINFSQTLLENSYQVQNLHNSDIFEGSVINKANVANFEFKCFLLRDPKHKKLVDLAIDYSSFDLYVATQQATFKIEKSVITNVSISASRDKFLSLDIKGEASKVLHVGSESFEVPGTLQNYPDTNYLRSRIDVILDSENISTFINNLSVELQNEITWVPYTSVQNAIEGSIQYPYDYVLSKRILAGSISRFVRDDSQTDLHSKNSNTPLRIKLGEESQGTFYGLDFNMGACSYTNRLNTGSVFTQNYDWRMIDNSDLSSIITYTTTI